MKKNFLAAVIGLSITTSAMQAHALETLMLYSGANLEDGVISYKIFQANSIVCKRK